ncbi:NUDIX domain-containing protein [Sporosarcina gallistercoris]|uniref:NUDIX domain-containing protein n=1 Tax=Sporosarcina gallistercoris TaxID=2762245 RepID=A0ABR8PHW6_9BACL|nr:NUDIX domain-containing protein [Sporosarcina gallistercoris]MBD7907763.1 NUDIX domain-containing protein [Sporosarcina gallistercoris]
MLSFDDLKGSRVELVFGEQELEARHVLVVLKYEGKWLLTPHKIRGVEFPGGKAEPGETIEQAAIREVMEETGVTVANLVKFAEYVVYTEPPFCKAVFTADVAGIDERAERFETDGALWFTDEQLDHCETLSFHMKDEGMKELRNWVEQHAH